jgi:hypothetical protein
MSLLDGKRTREQRRANDEAYQREMRRLDRAFALDLAEKLDGEQRKAVLRRIEEAFPEQ